MVQSDAVAEPDRKRSRVDKSQSLVSPPDPRHPPLPAKDVVQLRFLHSPDDFHDRGAATSHPDKLSAIPAYLHQIIPDEVVCGCRSASVAIYVYLPSLVYWIDAHLTPYSPSPADSPAPAPASASVSVSASASASTCAPTAGATVGTAAATMQNEPTDVPALITPFIKSGLAHSQSHFVAQINASYDIPVSNRISQYQRNGVHYAIYKETFFDGDTSDASKKNEALHDYHRRMAFLMFVQIDGASFIDDEDPRWEVFVIVRLENDTPSSFVGYATMYPFSALRKSSKNPEIAFSERIRISQVAIMQLEQRRGHGARLLHAVYKDAHARNALEVTVEDPSRGFRILRDVTDLSRAYQHKILSDSLTFPYADEKGLLNSLRTRLLISPTQARRCLEVHQFRITDRSNEAIYRTYRLWVKRRLFNDNIEVLDRYESDEKKQKLAEIYSDFCEEYEHSASRVNAYLRSGGTG